MKCPFCAHQEDKVIDSRESKEGDAIRRRRQHRQRHLAHQGLVAGDVLGAREGRPRGFPPLCGRGAYAIWAGRLLLGAAVWVGVRRRREPSIVGAGGRQLALLWLVLPLRARWADWGWGSCPALRPSGP